MAGMTLHVLDAARGAPAEGLDFELIGPGEHRAGRTDADGRATIDGLLPAGHFRLVLATGPWFRARRRPTFFAEVVIDVAVEAGRHHHLPLVLSPFAYSIACMPG